MNWIHRSSPMPGIVLMALFNASESLIYFPQPLAPSDRQIILARHPRAEEIWITAADGTRLHGWLVRSAQGQSRPLAIYFGGNAEEVSWMLGFADVFAGWDLALFNYRGYGLSAGKPSQDKLFQDALTIYDHFAHSPGNASGRIAVIGRSLGSGVATYLASQRPLQGVLLVAPFDSITDLVQRLYPLMPVKLLLGNLYDSVARAPAITTPVRMIIATHDEIIPNSHSQRLFDAWRGPKEIVTIAGAGHNNLQEHREYWQAIRDFLAKLLTPRPF